LWGGGVSLPRGYASLSQVWLGENCMTLGANLLVCRSLPNRFQNSVWWHGGPPVFPVYCGMN
jgi:hypothetical protein